MERFSLGENRDPRDVSLRGAFLIARSFLPLLLFIYFQCKIERAEGREEARGFGCTNENEFIINAVAAPTRVSLLLHPSDDEIGQGCVFMKRGTREGRGMNVRTGK